ALAGTVVAAALAWLIARRMVRPIEQLTSTATYVAETQDLANRIEVERHDEVGQLATSFNTMLDALHTPREQQKRLVIDASRELTLETHHPAIVDGRIGMLERALSNLVDNALKFSRPGSAVSVVVEGSRIDVLDRGPGIASDDRSRVFDRFYRASAARTKPG